jgi:crotonobetainyl-CoA hydratase
MGAAFARFRDDDSLHVAIVSGEGRIFSAGWDLKEAVSQGTDEDTDYGEGGFAGITELFALTKPVIAAVNGTAVGAGVELALACDMVVAAENAEFFLPETDLGITADAGGVQRLPRKIPINIAMEMLIIGRKLTAAEGARLGFINHVVPATAVMDKAREMARQIAGAAPLAVRAIKEIVHGTLHLSVEETFRRIKARGFPTYAAMLESEDHEEGPRAFAEKRRPKWKGK